MRSLIPRSRAAPAHPPPCILSVGKVEKDTEKRESVGLFRQEVANRYPTQIRLIEVRHDYELRQWQLSLTPDGFLHFVLTTKAGDQESYPILVEVDRDTESQTTPVWSAEGLLPPPPIQNRA